MIDLDKAAALLRAEGWAETANTMPGDYYPEDGGWVAINITSAWVSMSIDTDNKPAIALDSPEAAEDLADALGLAAALCRRIEAECQVEGA